MIFCEFSPVMIEFWPAARLFAWPFTNTNDDSLDSSDCSEIGMTLSLYSTLIFKVNFHEQTVFFANEISVKRILNCHSDIFSVSIAVALVTEAMS